MKCPIIIALLTLCFAGAAAQNPKREFRGAWLHTVWQDGYHKRSTEENKRFLRDQLDRLKQAGVNAILFQVRPQSDAFYESSLEPWSRYLTDEGKAPVPAWDPLQFLIDESHARGMELHAWLNPYRVTAAAAQSPAKSHIYYKHPEWFVKYNGATYFDPGVPESREFITEVVADIVARYDVDGIHFDDYFYPYPVKDKAFPDDKSYAAHGQGMDLGDWRRRNVDQLIEGIHTAIAASKPWVVFGISPFGIWRNSSSDPRGSATKGLQNYDDLYADVPKWALEGWIDYMLPQLYWNFDHPTAPYGTLVEWWNENHNGRHVFVGEDVGRTMKSPDTGNSADKTQLRHKVELVRKGENINGLCWWPGYSVADNLGGIADSLAIDLQATTALVPEYPWISDRRPHAPSNLSVADGVLSWESPAAPEGTPDDVVKYAVYRFEPDDPIDLDNTEALEAVTWSTSYAASDPGLYVVTSLSRVNCESEPSRPITVNDSDCDN